MRIDDIPDKPYRDEELLYYESNSGKIDYVITTLTPLVKLLIQIGVLAGHGESIFGGLETDNDINTRVGTLTPNQIMLHVSGLQITLKKRKLVQSDVLANMDALANEDVWVPFGERSGRNGELQLNPDFHTAVGSAMRAAQNIIDAIQQPQMQGQPQDTMAMDIGNDSSDSDANLMVQLDQDSAQCVFGYDATRSPPFVKARVGVKYMISMLGCLTPRGIVRDLIRGEDFVITGDDILTLNQRNVKQFEFRLTAASRDHPRVTFAFPNYVHTIPFSSAGVTEQLHVYVPVSQQTVVIPISYHSDYVDVQLPSVAASQLPPVVSIDPTQMIEQFAGDLRNIHLHADLRVPQCPMEQLVSARVNFATLTEPICTILDTLVKETERLDEADLQKYASKIPYIYCINMKDMTCKRTRMLRHDIKIPLLEIQRFEEYNAITQIETHLIRYILFQMLLTYRKFTWDDFKSCPEHCVIFDLYLRRDRSQIVYHYDLSPGTIVSTVGLLYSMPHGDVMMGAQLIPRRYRTDQQISSTTVKPLNPLVARNTVALFNNATWSHSTPDVQHIMSRTQNQVEYEVRDDKNNPIYTANLDVTYNPVEFPESIKNKIKKSSENPSRTFLRSWHIVSISAGQQANIGHTEDVVFPKHTFEELANITMRECFDWMQRSNCMCIEVGVDPAIGEIVHPTVLPGFHGGKLMPPNLLDRPNPSKTIAPLFGPSKTIAPSFAPSSSKSSKSSKSQTQSSKSQTQSSKSKTQSSARRSSTTSVSHLKQQIISKINQLRTVLENPKKNVIVVAGKIIRTPRRTRSHTQFSRKSSASKYTRKVRSV